MNISYARAPPMNEGRLGGRRDKSCPAMAGLWSDSDEECGWDESTRPVPRILQTPLVGVDAYGGIDMSTVHLPLMLDLSPIEDDSNDGFDRRHSSLDSALGDHHVGGAPHDEAGDNARSPGEKLHYWGNVDGIWPYLNPNHPRGPRGGSAGELSPACRPKATQPPVVSALPRGFLIPAETGTSPIPPLVIASPQAPVLRSQSPPDAPSTGDGRAAGISSFLERHRATSGSLPLDTPVGSPRLPQTRLHQVPTPYPAVTRSLPPEQPTLRGLLPTSGGLIFGDRRALSGGEMSPAASNGQQNGKTTLEGIFRAKCREHDAQVL